MDFFAHQDAARRRTGRLVVLFVLAVLLTIVAAYLVVAGAIVITQSRSRSGEVDWSLAFHPLIALAVGLGTIAIVGGGSLYKINQLRAGGSILALELGGRRVTHDAADYHERRLLNVVEEMAIASGTPVPAVYVLEHEPGINAFAAGYSPADAVIGVTRGAVEQLTRDQLQGVIAHEFSHILNGDMRINIRAIGILHGILILGIIGYYILRAGAYSGGSRRSDKGGGAVILLVGVGLMAVGFIGTFFGNWIKAALCRQREFLADASAVQFTRQPEGLAGALRRIGGYRARSTVKSPNAPEASHMFFSQAITSGLHSLFATHPPLKTRIRRIDPSWDGTWLTAPPVFEDMPASPAERSPAEKLAIMAGVTAATVAADASPQPRSVLASIGDPSPAHVQYAQDLLSRVPRRAIDAARDPFGARAVVLRLLLADDEATRAAQLAVLQEDGVLQRLVGALAGETIEPAARLPLLDLALPALRDLTEPQYDRFNRYVSHFVRADRRIDLFEWALSHVLLANLGQHFARLPHVPIRYYALTRLARPCSILLSAIARAGHDDESAAARAFATGAAHLSVAGMAFQPADACTLEAVDQALNELATVAPKAMRPLITACAATVAADREVTTREAELLRAIADTLGCPVPPMLPGQPLV